MTVSLTNLAQARYHLIDQPVRGRSSGGNADTICSVHVRRVDLFISLNQETAGALFLANSQQLNAVRGMFAADDVEDIDQSGQRARHPGDRELPSRSC